MERGESSLASGNCNNDKKLKKVWKPSVLGNGDSENVSTLDTNSWPALSESARVPSKSKSLSDGHSFVASPSQGHGSSNQPITKEKSNASSNMTPRASALRSPSQPRLVNGNGNFHGVSSKNNCSNHPSFHTTAMRYPPANVPHNGHGYYEPIPPHNGHMSPMEPRYGKTNWDARAFRVFGPQVGYEQENFSIKDNYGLRGCRNSDYHNNYGGSSDRGRNSYVNGGHVHMQNSRAPLEGFIRPPYNGTLQNHNMFFPNNIYNSPFQVGPHRGTPIVSAPAATIIPVVAEPPLSTRLLQQIEYYFSDVNLVDDYYLKSKMDDQGWVPINIIAEFRRVKSITNNIQFILDSLRSSQTVEIQDYMVRRRGEWAKWISR